MSFFDYDVIVVGAGHAGCEAAASAANMGCKVLLVTMNMNTIAQMSCNPAMGGVAKGQIVREIDALGGYSGIISDKTAIQFRMLNQSKGPAMWSPRTQNDRMRFAEEWRMMLELTHNVDFWQDMVAQLVIKENKVKGVITGMGKKFTAKTVILTNGTFLNGLIHIGEKNFSGGRSGEKAATGITEQLKTLGFSSGRMKTGTPPRLDGRTLEWSVMELQPGDEPAGKFSYTDTPMIENQLPCHITYTNSDVHEILKEGFEQSPMFSGRIQGLGPRYCPSIEDKIVRFSERDRHQLFVEPEGRNTCEIYLNGFSSSLPEEIQLKALRKIQGLEKAKMFRPGYAIEYDYFPPDQLQLTLETRLIENLYFAGQINGTTGYEEAAGQGLVAGINAALKVKEQNPFILGRDEAYIGVLIDDLIHKGTEEPYRMFTSRAEYRILLRQDNADLRLTPKSYALDLAKRGRMDRVEQKQTQTSEIVHFLSNLSIDPDQANGVLEQIGEVPMKQKIKAIQLLLRPNIDLNILQKLNISLQTYLKKYPKEYIEQAEIQIKYASYIEKEALLAEKWKQLENIPIYESFDYAKVFGLSGECREKLRKYKPSNLGQASRISGISASDISILLIYFGK